jgi:predicted HicB family RNase H-like nuclease
VRVSNDLWQQVSTKAKAEGATVSSIIIRALKEYLIIAP